MSVLLKWFAVILAASVSLSVRQSGYCQSRAVLERRINGLDEKFDKMLTLQEGQALGWAAQEQHQREMRVQLQRLQSHFQELQRRHNELALRNRQLETRNTALNQRFDASAPRLICFRYGFHNE